MSETVPSFTTLMFQRLALVAWLRTPSADCSCSCREIQNLSQSYGGWLTLLSLRFIICGENSLLMFIILFVLKLFGPFTAQMKYWISNNLQSCTLQHNCTVKSQMWNVSPSYMCWWRGLPVGFTLNKHKQELIAGDKSSIHGCHTLNESS